MEIEKEEESIFFIKYIENKDKNIYYADHNHLKFRHGPGILSADRQSTLVHDNHFIPHDPFKLNDNDIKQNLLIIVALYFG